MASENPFPHEKNDGKGFDGKKFRPGVIGCGGMAAGKRLILPAKCRQQVDITAFCDRIPERAEKVRQQFQYPEAGSYTDDQELLKDETLAAAAKSKGEVKR